MSYIKSPYKELGINPQSILGSVGEEEARRREKRKLSKDRWKEKKRIKEMLESGKAPIAIGNKTGGHW